MRRRLFVIACLASAGWIMSVLLIVGCSRSGSPPPAAPGTKAPLVSVPAASVQATPVIGPPASGAPSAEPPDDVSTAQPPKEIRARQITWPFTTDPESKDVQRSGLIPATIEVGPNETQTVRVSIQERGIDNVGPQLRASLWMASFLAATSLDLPLTCCTFSIVPGSIDKIYNKDGYSAGAVTTVAMMAALKNRELLPNVTMTGTLNPDGSVGPVRNIRNKLLAAVHEGKRVFGIPAGQSYDWDAKSTRMEDLRELAAKHDVLLVEIKDIYDAYRLLTGRGLTQSRQLSIERMETKLEWIKDRVELWQRQTRDKLRQLQQMIPEDAGEEVRRSLNEKVIKPSEKAINETESLSRSKMYALAYYGALEGYAYAAAWLQLLEKEKEMGSDSLQTMAEKLVEYRSVTQQRWLTAKQELEVRIPTTINEAVELIDLYAFAMDGWARLRTVSEELRKRSQKPLRAEDRADLRTLFWHIAYADAIFDITTQEQRSRGSEQRAAVPHLKFDEKAMHRLAEAYTSAARANQKYYEEEVNRQGNRAQFLDMLTNPTRTCRDVLAYAIDNAGEEGIHAALAALGAAIKAYSCVAASLAPVQSGPLGYGEKLTLIIKDKRAFAEMLMLADNKAREAAFMALDVTHDDVPLSSRVWYAAARMMRESEAPEEKISALHRFWDSSTRSRLAVLIYRTAMTQAGAGKSSAAGP